MFHRLCQKKCREKKVENLVMDSLYIHMFFGFSLRVLFITYGIIQDSISEVPFTDIDYKVFTDAARNMAEGISPYETPTYRYPPIIAALMIPNLLHPCYGKILFSFSDIFVYYMLFKILMLDGNSRERSKNFALVWLYNPLSIIITTRGNADSVSSFFVILTLYLFYKKNYLWSAIAHGVAVHIRLYPIVFSLGLYISIKDNHKNIFLKMFFPNKKRLMFTLVCLVTFSILTAFFYLMYGYDFLHESLLYHLKRVDIRHNYSVYFYLNYLNYTNPLLETKIMTVLPMILLLFLTLTYAEKHIAFCEMTSAFVLVMFNSVITCQYFIWYLSLLPLCLPKMSCSWKELFLVSNFWFASQAAWLLPAYLLEFKSQDTYFYIWVQCLVFFWANVIVLSSFIRSYNVSKIKSK